MTITISTRLQAKEAREIEKFAKEEDLDKSTFVKRLINRSLQDYKAEHAFKLYKEGKVSLGKAAELADRSLWEMIELMKMHSITLSYSLEDLKDDIAAIKGIR